MSEKICCNVGYVANACRQLAQRLLPVEQWTGIVPNQSGLVPARITCSFVVGIRHVDTVCIHMIMTINVTSKS